MLLDCRALHFGLLLLLLPGAVRHVWLHAIIILLRLQLHDLLRLFPHAGNHWLQGLPHIRPTHLPGHQM